MSLQWRFTSHKREALKLKELCVEQALEMIGLDMERAAKENITALEAIDTGRLRNSITHATDKYEGQGNYQDNIGNSYGDARAISTPEENSVHVGTNVEYGPYIEFGTSRMAARPFLEPALQNNLDRYKKMLQQCLDSAGIGTN